MRSSTGRGDGGRAGGVRGRACRLTGWPTLLLLVAISSGPTARGAAAPINRLPVPSAEAIATADKLVRQVYREEYSALKTQAQKRALSQRLRGEAATINEPASKYVLLRDARDLASQGGDVNGAIRAVDDMAAAFDVDPIKLKVDLLTPVRGAGGAEAAALSAQWLDLADQAMAADQFDLAVRAGQSAENAARASADAAVIADGRTRLGVITAAAREAAKVKGAFDKLKTAPDDPAACLAVGRFYCFVRGDFERGLPLLAKGSDAALAKVAGTELTAPENPVAQKELADAWWAMAEKDLPNRAAYQRRAAWWYYNAAPGLDPALKRVATARVTASGATFTRPARRPPSQAVATAMSRATAFLYGKVNAWGHWDAQAIMPTTSKEYEAFRVEGGQWGGNTALVVLALIEAGEDPKREPALRQAIDQLTHMRLVGVYSTSLRIQALTRADPVKHKATIAADAQTLARAVSKTGHFFYTVDKPNENTSGDLSTLQFGWIGLAEAQRAGGPRVPPLAWATVVDSVAKGQLTDGGFAYRAGSGNTATPSMTAAAATVLLLAREGGAPAAAQTRAEQALERVTRWFAVPGNLSFTVSGMTGAYRLTCIQRVGLLSGQRMLGGNDWFQVGSGQILSHQDTDGSFRLSGTSIATTVRPTGRTAPGVPVNAENATASNATLHETALCLLFLARGGAN